MVASNGRADSLGADGTYRRKGKGRSGADVVLIDGVVLSARRMKHAIGETHQL